MFQLQGVGGEVRHRGLPTPPWPDNTQTETLTKPTTYVSLDKLALYATLIKVLFVCYPGLDSSGRENQNKTKDFDSFKKGDRTDKYLLTNSQVCEL